MNPCPHPPRSRARRRAIVGVVRRPVPSHAALPPRPLGRQGPPRATAAWWCSTGRTPVRAVRRRSWGLVLFEYGVGEHDRIKALYGAYVAAGGPGRITRPADLTVLVAQTGHIALLGCERWVASTSAAERRHNEIWVREVRRRPGHADNCRDADAGGGVLALGGDVGLAPDGEIGAGGHPEPAEGCRARLRPTQTSAARTTITSGRSRTISRQDSPASAEAQTAPLRPPK